MGTRYWSRSLRFSLCLSDKCFSFCLTVFVGYCGVRSSKFGGLSCSSTIPLLLDEMYWLLTVGRNNHHDHQSWGKRYQNLIYWLITIKHDSKQIRLKIARFELLRISVIRGRKTTRVDKATNQKGEPVTWAPLLVLQEELYGGWCFSCCTWTWGFLWESGR